MTPGVLSRRLLAGVIDGLVFAVPALAVGGLLAWRGRDDEHVAERIHRRLEPLGRTRVADALRVVQAVVVVARRNAPSPGYSITGLRVVDARSGGPVTLRSALVRQLLLLAVQQMIRRLNEPWRRQLEERQRATEARVRTLREEPTDDPVARDEAIWQAKRDGATGCGRGMIRPLLLSSLHPLTALLSARRQTVAERLAGIAVVD